MAAATATEYGPVIRELWPEQRINDLTFEDRPLLGLMPKDQTFSEKTRHRAIKYGNGQGVSANFTNAESNRSATLYKDWQLTRLSHYYSGSIDGDTLESTRDNKAALVSAWNSETEGGFMSLRDEMHKIAWGSGTGSLGQIKAGTTPTTTIELANVEDINNFHVNMVLVASATDGGALGDTNTTKVTKVDRNDGILTVTPSVAGLGHPWVAGDFMYRQGNAQAGASFKIPVGVRGWVPSTDPTSTLFFGVDRSTDVTMLGGVRYNGASDGSVREAISRGLYRINRMGMGARPDYIFMNPDDVGQLVTELEGNVSYDKVSAGSVPVKQPNGRMGTQKASVGFEVITFSTSMGFSKVVPDHLCPVNVAYALTMRTWRLESLREAPRFLSLDDNQMLRISGEDSVEFRQGARFQISCDAPGLNGRIALPA